ncbi:unnamed protein product [Gordionus sp. m RMFG-2023]
MHLNNFKFQILINFSKIHAIQVAHFNSNFASICKVHRKIYPRFYPTVLVNSDGSSYNIRYFEPRKIIKLPLDLTTLSDEEKQIRLAKMRPKIVLTHKEEISNRISSMKYVDIMKSKT